MTDKDYEEILTIIIQAKTLIPKLSYNEKLEEVVFDCMKNKKELSRESIQKVHNNYLALNLIGLNQCNTETFKKLDNYMDNEY